MREGNDVSRHIGIVACSAGGAALCYRTVCAEGAQVLVGELMLARQSWQPRGPTLIGPGNTLASSRLRRSSTFSASSSE